MNSTFPAVVVVDFALQLLLYPNTDLHVNYYNYLLFAHERSLPRIRQLYIIIIII